MKVVDVWPHNVEHLNSRGKTQVGTENGVPLIIDLRQSALGVKNGVPLLINDQVCRLRRDFVLEVMKKEGGPNLRGVLYLLLSCLDAFDFELKFPNCNLVLDPLNGDSHFDECGSPGRRPQNWRTKPGEAVPNPNEGAALNPSIGVTAEITGKKDLNFTKAPKGIVQPRANQVGSMTVQKLTRANLLGAKLDRLASCLGTGSQVAPESSMT